MRPEPARRAISVADLTARITRVDLAWRAYPFRRHPSFPFLGASPGALLLLFTAYTVSPVPVSRTLTAAVAISFAISWPTGQRYLQPASARLSAAVSAVCCVVAVGTLLPWWPSPELQPGRVPEAILPQFATACRLILVGGSLLGLLRLALAHFLSAGAQERRRHRRNRDRPAYGEIIGGWPARRRPSGKALKVLGRRSRRLVGVAMGALLQLVLITVVMQFFMGWKPAVMVSALLTVTGIGTWRMALTFTQSTSEEARDADRRKSIFILRAFADDTLTVPGCGVDYPAHRLAYPIRRSPDRHRFEEVMVHGLRFLAPIVTVGDPREGLPSSGAAREYVRGDRREHVPATEWQRIVRARMLEAGCLVYVVADTESLRWELETGAGIHGKGPLVFAFSPIPEADLEARWRGFTSFAESIVGVPLPGLTAKPLAAFFAGDDLVWLDGEDRTGRSYMLALRAAVVLARHRFACVAEVESFLRDEVPGLGLSVSAAQGGDRSE